jgi:hypothetical protein
MLAALDEGAALAAASSGPPRRRMLAWRNDIDLRSAAGAGGRGVGSGRRPALQMLQSRAEQSRAPQTQHLLAVAQPPVDAALTCGVRAYAGVGLLAERLQLQQHLARGAVPVRAAELRVRRGCCGSHGREAAGCAAAGRTAAAAAAGPGRRRAPGAAPGQVLLEQVHRLADDGIAAPKKGSVFGPGSARERIGQHAKGRAQLPRCPPGWRPGATPPLRLGARPADDRPVREIHALAVGQVLLRGAGEGGAQLRAS